MLTAITSFSLPPETPPEKIRQVFVDSAPRFLGMAGLRYKCFHLAEDCRTGGAFYVWEDRSHADAFFTEEWKAFMQDKYGSLPQVTYYEGVVEIDNVMREIRTV